jgi:hypothetical protein
MDKAVNSGGGNKNAAYRAKAKIAKIVFAK